MKNLLLALIIAPVMLTSCGADAGKPGGDSTPAVSTSVHYACPMECEPGTAYDTIGKCPVCQMDMEESK
jgi:hypothetical protein